MVSRWRWLLIRRFTLCEKRAVSCCDRKRLRRARQSDESDESEEAEMSEQKKILECKCCPFCGGLEVEVCRTNIHACWIRCSACGADAQSHKTRRGAVAQWNRRRDLAARATIVSDDDKEYGE